jgi:hypothetical protein
LGRNRRSDCICTAGPYSFENAKTNWKYRSQKLLQFRNSKKKKNWRHLFWKLGGGMIFIRCFKGKRNVQFRNSCLTYSIRVNKSQTLNFPSALINEINSNQCGSLLSIMNSRVVIKFATFCKGKHECPVPLLLAVCWQLALQSHYKVPPHYYAVITRNSYWYH